MLSQLFLSYDRSVQSFYSPTHLSSELSRNGRWAFSASRKVFCYRVIIYVFLSCLLLLFRCSTYLLVCMHLCTHKLLLMLVTCCNNCSAFICVGGLVIVHSFSFYLLSLIYCPILGRFVPIYIRTFYSSKKTLAVVIGVYTKSTIIKECLMFLEKTMKCTIDNLFAQQIWRTYKNWYNGRFD